MGELGLAFWDGDAQNIAVCREWSRSQSCRSCRSVWTAQDGISGIRGIPVSLIQIRMFCDALISHFGGAGRDEDAEQTLHPQPRDERRRQGINSAVPWGHQHPSPQTSILQRMPRALSLSPKNTCPEGLLYGK